MGVRLTTHLHVLPMLRMGGAIPPLRQYAYVACVGNKPISPIFITHLCFYAVLTKTYFFQQSQKTHCTWLYHHFDTGILTSYQAYTYLVSFILNSWGRSSGFGIITRLCAGRSRVRIPEWARDFSLLQSRLVLGPTQAPVQ